MKCGVKALLVPLQGLLLRWVLVDEWCSRPGMHGGLPWATSTLKSV